MDNLNLIRFSCGMIGGLFASFIYGIPILYLTMIHSIFAGMISFVYMYNTPFNFQESLLNSFGIGFIFVILCYIIILSIGILTTTYTHFPTLAL